MNKCKDPHIAAMLHAYELELLNAEDRQVMELHLLDCDACFESLKSFAPASTLLKQDSDIRGEIAASDSVAPDERPAPSRKAFSFQSLFRYAAAAVIVLAFGVLTYRYIVHTAPATAKGQNITLAAIRSSSPAVVDLTAQESVHIRFFVDSSPNPHGYAAVLQNPDSTTITTTIKSSEIDADGYGSLSVTTNQLKPGLLRLAISIRDSVPQTIVREYYLRAR